MLPGLAHGTGCGVLRNRKQAIVRDATRFTVAKAMGVLSVCSEVLPQQQAGRLDTESTGHGHTQAVIVHSHRSWARGDTDTALSQGKAWTWGLDMAMVPSLFRSRPVHG